MLSETNVPGNTALELHHRLGGTCMFGSTGLGWPGPHHCFWCYVEVERMTQ